MNCLPEKEITGWVVPRINNNPTAEYVTALCEQFKKLGYRIYDSKEFMTRSVSTQTEEPVLRPTKNHEHYWVVDSGPRPEELPTTIDADKEPIVEEPVWTAHPAEEVEINTCTFYNRAYKAQNMGTGTMANIATNTNDGVTTDEGTFIETIMI